MLRPLTISLLLTTACTPGAEPSEPPPAAEEPAAEPSEGAPAAPPVADPPAAETGAGPRTFGQPLSAAPLTPLASILGAPSDFAGQTVKTEGTITQVCQRMGCWMELQAEGTSPVRVPMAGHDFFLPRDVSGRLATIEGTVSLRELSEAERAHLESEGATATAHALEIAASGVVVR